MSIDDADRRSIATMPDTRGAVVASVVFVILLASAIIWPKPVLWINGATVDADLSISSVSFLGREAPSWDVVYWGLVGFAVLALFHGRLGAAADTWGNVRQELSDLRRRGRRFLTSLRVAPVVVSGVLIIGVCLTTWAFIDAPLMAQITTVGSERVHDFVRLSNRLGGGGNPPMIVGYFILAGLAFRRARWTMLGFAMASSAAAVGILASALKPLVARSRPDLWLGPFSRISGGESSFPSGHAISAFAMAGAVFAGSRSRGLRVAAFLMALSIGATRVIALRHWPSDVLVSAVIGWLSGFAAGKLFVRQGGGDEAALRAATAID